MRDPTGSGGGGGRLSGDDAARLSERIAGLTGAGLPLGPGLRASARELGRGRLRSSMTAVADALEAGAPVEDALDERVGRLPPLLGALLRTGVRGGRVGEVLGRYVGFHNVGVDLRHGLWVNLAYPCFAVLLSLLLFVYVASTIGRAFEAIFRDFGVSLPGVTVAILVVSRAFAVDTGVLTTGFLGILVVLPLFLLVIGPATRRGLLVGVPVIGAVWRNTSLAEFCHLLALTLEGGVPLPEAVRLVGGGVDDAAIGRACRSMAVDLGGGSSLADAVGRERVFPAGLARLLRWAEKNQTLAEALHTSGEMFEARARAQASFAGTLLNVLAVVWGLFGVFSVVLGLMLPLVTLITKLSG